MLGILKEKFREFIITQVISNFLNHSDLCTVEYTYMCGYLISTFWQSLFQDLLFLGERAVF